MNYRTNRFPELAQFRVPLGFRALVEAAAEGSHLAPPEYMRRAMLTGLEALGVTLPKTPQDKPETAANG